MISDFHIVVAVMSIVIALMIVVALFMIMRLLSNYVNGLHEEMICPHCGFKQQPYLPSGDHDGDVEICDNCYKSYVIHEHRIFNCEALPPMPPVSFEN